MEEASFVNSSLSRLDAERALDCKRISFEDRMITFASLTDGGTRQSREFVMITFASLTDGGTRQSREFVGRRWGMSAGRVNKIAERTIESMVRHTASKCCR